MFGAYYCCLPHQIILILMQNNLTIIICAYNCEQYIEQTLQGVVNQTFQDFNLLIIDDCSTDSSVQKVKSFFNQNKRDYKLVEFKKNGGIAAARKYAIENIETIYYMFHDADDIAYPNLVKKLFTKIIDDTDLIGVGCYLEYINESGKKLGGGLYIGETTKDGFIKKAKANKLIFMQPTAIINREFALKAGGFKIEGFEIDSIRYQDYCEDLDLFTRMSDFFKEGKAIIVLPEVLCKYRKMDNTTSSNTFGMLIKMKYVKFNLLRRRNGLNELKFTEFYKSLSNNEIDGLKKDADAAVLLKQGYILIKRKRVVAGAVKILKSVIKKPNYFKQKVFSNFIK